MLALIRFGHQHPDILAADFGCVFGGLIATVVGFVIGLLFKLLVFVALVGGLVYVVRKFMSSSSSRSDW